MVFWILFIGFSSSPWWGGLVVADREFSAFLNGAVTFGSIVGRSASMCSYQHGGHDAVVTMTIIS